MSAHERTTYLGAWLILCFLTLALATVALAHDKVHPVNNTWLKELKNADGAVCCDGDDVVHLKDPNWKIVGDYATGKQHYEVQLAGDWIVVQDSQIVNMKNRDGIAKVWPYAGSRGMAVRCFQPGSMG